MHAPRDIADLVKIILDILNPLIVLVAALCLFVFFKGLTIFIAKAGDEKSHGDGKRLMVWGIVALFVMVSFLGLIHMAQQDLGVSSSSHPIIPQFPEDK
jgi:hypothetical protein